MADQSRSALPAAVIETCNPLHSLIFKWSDINNGDTLTCRSNVQNVSRWIGKIGIAFYFHRQGVCFFSTNTRVHLLL